ncbi:tyrosinase precursor [Ilyonectria robusta]
MVDGTYAITGLPRPADAVTKTKKIPYVTNLPLRYEISAFASSKDKETRKQWTLYVLALERFKTKPVDEKLSYFQVAGIHGYPETVWDNAPPPRPDPVGEQPPGAQPFGGYCNHNGINFPNWHRPYMLLFEQCIWNNMKDVIKHWQDKHKLPDSEAQVWYAAAEKWRLPYWDWARKQTYTQDFAYPEVLTQGTVRIYPPAAVKEYYPPNGSYANPLWGFDNPELDADGDPLPFGQMPEGKTKWNINDDPVEHVKELPDPENPKKTDWIPWSQATGVSRYGIFVNNEKTGFRGLDGINNPWTANTFLSSVNLLKSDDPTIRLKQNPGNLADSVNRMFCPEYNSTWGQFASTKWRNEGHTNSTGYMSLEYIHNNVHPFHNKTDGDPAKDVWTAELCRNWTDLGYQYDDLMKLSQNALAPDGTLDEQKFISDLQVYINATYPSTAHLVNAIREAPKVETPEGLAPDDADEKSKSWKDYIINVLYDRYALNGRSYTIEFYLGGPENQPKTHYEPQNLVGRIYTFGGGVRSSEAGCSNCKKQSDAGVMSCGQVPLTIELLHHALDHVHDHPIANFNEVEDYLKLHLRWRFVQSGGAVLDASNFPNTEISVLRGVGRPRQVKKTAAPEGGVRYFAMEALSLEANAAAPTLPPVYSDYEALPEITQGKPGGAPIPS